MRKLFFITTILVFAISVNAQQDAKAKGILDQVSQKTRSYKNITADFTFSLENKELKIKEVNEGTIKIKGQKYTIDIPGSGVKVVSDGKTIWNYMKKGNQVTISNIEDKEGELMDPSTVFTIYEKGFRSKFIAEKTMEGKALYQIELYPDKKEFEVTKIDLEINKATMAIHAAQLYGTEGNQYGIRVKKFDPDKEIADAEFTFDAKKYPGVEVVDLR